MTTHLDDVKEFYTSFGQEGYIAAQASLAPDNIGPERLHLKLTLIAEEFIELIEAAYGSASAAILEEAWAKAQAADEEVRDIVEVADALADLDYVLNGLAVESGIPLDKIFEEVHESNMSKLDDNGEAIISDGVTPSEYDGKTKPIGKILKSKNFWEPDIATILKNHNDWS